MQCPVCGFENIAAQTECFRCHTMFGQDVAVPAVPRAGRLRAFRRLRFSLNRLASSFPEFTGIPGASIVRGDEPLPAKSVAATFASIVPGLGHVLVGQARRGLLWFGAWVASLLLALWITPAGWEFAVLCWIFTLHGCIAFDAGGYRSMIRDWQLRLRMLGIILLPAIPVALLCNSYIQTYLPRGMASFSSKLAGIRATDTLLFRPGTIPQPGEIVLCNNEERRVVEARFQTEQVAGRNGENVPVVMALPVGRWTGLYVAGPGETIHFSHDAVRTSRGVFRKTDFPEINNGWPAKPIEFRTEPNECLVLFPVGGRVTLDVFLLPREIVLGPARAVHLPIHRRTTIP